MKGFRPDFREPLQIRPIAQETGISSGSDGSCRFIQGDTIVLATVQGPILPQFSRHEKFDSATIIVDFNIGQDHTRQEKVWGKFIQDSLEVAVNLKEYPRKSIYISISAIQTDGAVIACALNAAAIAIADAGISMKFLPLAITVFSPRPLEYSIDPTDSEESKATGILTIVAASNSIEEASPVLVNSKFIGSSSIEEFQKLLDIAVIGIKAVVMFCRKAGELAMNA